MATNAIALPEGFELDEPAVAKPSGPPAGFVLDAPKAPEQPKGLPPGFVLDSPVSKGNKTAGIKNQAETWDTIGSMIEPLTPHGIVSQPGRLVSAIQSMFTGKPRQNYDPQPFKPLSREDVSKQGIVDIPAQLYGAVATTGKDIDPTTGLPQGASEKYDEAKRVLTAIARPLENIARQAVEPENAFYSLAAGGEPLVAGAGAVVTPIEKTLGKIVKWLVAGQLASNVPSSTAHRTKEVEQNPEHPYLQALESSVGSAGDVGLPLLVAKSAVKDDIATSGLRSRDFDSSTPSGRELILASAREGLPNNPREIQRKIIANAFEQAAYRAKAGEARRGETQQLAPGQKPEVDEALTRMNELKQEADRLYGQLELAKQEATLAKQEQAVREGSLAAPEARGEAPVIGEPIYGENLVQPEVAGGEIKPVYQAAGEPKQGGQVSFGSEASAGGVPSARQAGHEGAFGGAEQPKGVIPQVVDIVTSKDRLGLSELRKQIKPVFGVARETNADLLRLIDARLKELRT